MRTLNDPVECDDPRDAREWTPARGLLRATWQGLIVALLFGGLLVPLAVYLPFLIIPLWLRTPLAFGIAWLLLVWVQRSAGMVGPYCSVLALALTGVVLASNHVVFALHGVHDPWGIDPWWVAPIKFISQVVPEHKGVFIGWEWCHPWVLLMLNLLPLLVGGGFCAALRARG